MNTSILDVTEFLDTITAGYTSLGQNAAALSHELPTLPLDHILKRCNQLNEERLRLANLDAKLIEILELAGEELTCSGDLERYRRAFSFTVNTFDTIYMQLHAMKAGLEDTQKH